MAMPARQRVSAAAYLAAERAAEFRSELWDGEVVAMSGARFAHVAVVANLMGALSTRLKGSLCRPLSNDMRVAADPHGRYFYPDVVIVCGKPVLLDEQMDTLVNPTVVIEVLSKSTEQYDRTYKADAYRAMPSVKQFVVVDSRSRFVESHQRVDERTWTVTNLREDHEILHFPNVEASISLADIYDRVEFEPEPIPTESE